MDDDPEDVPESIDYFSRQPKFVLKLSSEELQSKKKDSAVDKCAETVNTAPKDDFQPSLLSHLSAADKRLLRKVQIELQKNVKRFEAANNKVLSSLNMTNVNEIEDEGIKNDEKFLTVFHLYRISTLKYDEDEKFSAIFQRVADSLKLNVSEFRLCHRNRNIKLDDTPRSLNLSYSDIVECIPYKFEGKERAKVDSDSLQLLFQASDMKEKIEIYVKQFEVMQDIMEKYSNIRNIPLEQMLFEFDGEKISGTETPQGLDMESGSCIDVRVLNAEDILSRRDSRKINSEVVIDLTLDD